MELWQDIHSGSLPILILNIQSLTISPILKINTLFDSKSLALFKLIKFIDRHLTLFWYFCTLLFCFKNSIFYKFWKKEKRKNLDICKHPLKISTLNMNVLSCYLVHSISSGKKIKANGQCHKLCVWLFKKPFMDKGWSSSMTWISWFQFFRSKQKFLKKAKKSTIAFKIYGY